MAISLRFHAIFSAYLSIAAGIVEAVMSIIAGHEEISMSLYGIALMAFVDITGSVLVLNLWQCSNAVYGAERPKSERYKEIHYSIIIGYLMICLGIFLLADSTKSLVFHGEPKHLTPIGLIVSVFGASFGLGLAAYKFYVGKSLDSPVIVADSVSSLCSGISSTAALVVSFIAHEVWWSDGVTGFLSALYTLYSGTMTVISSNREVQAVISGHQGINGVLFKPRSYHEYDEVHNYNEVNNLNPRKGVIDRIFSGNFPWHSERNGYNRLPELDSEIDEEITFST